MAELRIIFLYVGQGDGTFIIFPDNTTVLIDLGSLKNSQTAGLSAVNTVYTELQTLGKTTIDYLFITHPDRDHNNLLKELDYKLSGNKLPYTYPYTNVYIGGQKSDYSDVYVKAMLNNKETNGHLTLFADCDHDLPNAPRWPNIGGVEMFLLSANVPTRNAPDPNPKSIVLMLAYCGWKIILTGDAENSAEDYMLNTSYTANKAFLKAFALKLGHHGAETATSDGWIETVLPGCVVISSDQKWGHPYCSVLTRLEAKTTIWTRSAMKHGYVCGTYTNTNKRTRDGKVIRYNWSNFDNTNLVFTTLVYADQVHSSSLGGLYEMRIRDTDSNIEFLMEAGLSGSSKDSGWFNSNGT